MNIMDIFTMALVYALLPFTSANSILSPRVVPPTLQEINIIISSGNLPGQVTYQYTWEALANNAVPYAMMISGPEGLGPITYQPPPNLGIWGINLSGVDQLTSSISIDTNNLGIGAYIDEGTRELDSCTIDARNPTVIVSVNGQTETVSAQVWCSTAYPA